MNTLRGQLAKMTVNLSSQGEANYAMVLGQHQIEMNPLMGKTITLQYHGEINCVHCNRRTKKSFSGGFCYPCSQKLAQCDICFLKPELCHYQQGTCREPDWGQAVCMQDHIVYLANSSGLKVGITRINQVPTRWIDQGATQAIPILRVASRFLSGLVEVIFKAHVSDRTDWRKMLKGEAEPMDLAAERDRLFALCEAELSALQETHGGDALKLLRGESQWDIRYPVLKYPTKVSSHNLDKTPEVKGVLEGIKGQYLILDTGVINLRKYSGYQIEVVM